VATLMTNSPGYEKSKRVRTVQEGTNGPRYEQSRVRIVQGTNSPGTSATMSRVTTQRAFLPMVDILNTSM